MVEFENCMPEVTEKSVANDSKTGLIMNYVVNGSIIVFVLICFGVGLYMNRTKKADKKSADAHRTGTILARVAADEDTAVAANEGTEVAADEGTAVVADEDTTVTAQEAFLTSPHARVPFDAISEL